MLDGDTMPPRDGNSNTYCSPCAISSPATCPTLAGRAHHWVTGPGHDHSGGPGPLKSLRHSVWPSERQDCCESRLHRPGRRNPAWFQQLHTGSADTGMRIDWRIPHPLELMLQAPALTTWVTHSTTKPALERGGIRPHVSPTQGKTDLSMASNKAPNL